MRYITTALALTIATVLGGCDGVTSSASLFSGDVKTIEVGKTGTAHGVEVTVTSSETTNQIGSTGLGVSTGPEEIFVVVKYTIKNTSTEPMSLIGRLWPSLQDADGQKYAIDDLASGLSSVEEDSSSMAFNLNPGVSVKSAAVWKIAKSGYDPKSWTVVFATNPVMAFALE